MYKRIKLLKLAIKDSYLQDIAHISNVWGGLLSTLMYTVTFIFFIDIVMAKYQTFAGYNREEVLFVALIGQAAFYLLWLLPWTNYPKMIESVRSGSLDYLLTKPVPQLFFLSRRDLHLLNILLNTIPTLTIFALFINWSQLHFDIVNVLAGIVIFLCGQLVMDAVSFLFAVPVFWLGDSDRILRILNDVIESKIPFEGFSSTFQIFLTTIFPVLLANVVPASVILGKANPTYWVAIAISITMLFVWLKNYIWKLACRNYASASS